MDRQHILDEIRRVAAANGGVAPGQTRFHSETGLRESDWKGRYWARWSDALAEAGFEPNEFNQSYDEARLIESYVDVMRRLGHMPTTAELMMESRARGTPWGTTFRRQLGTRGEIIARLRAYCHERAGYGDVLAMLPEEVKSSAPIDTGDSATSEAVRGYVYLLKSGNFYKIGRSNSTGRREYEVGLKLPTRTSLVHEIATDDPSGIEAYWHRRFAPRRGNGEWFSLTAEDVRAFRRRKFM
jgi:hypothetical protein